jgi:hypothetical protein
LDDATSNLYEVLWQKAKYSYLNFQARKEILLSAGLDQYESLVAVSVSLFEEFDLEKESPTHLPLQFRWMDARLFKDSRTG